MPSKMGAVVAGQARGGYNSIFVAAQHTARLMDQAHRPIVGHKDVYDQSHVNYARQHDYLGRSAKDVTKRLKALETSVQKAKPLYHLAFL